MFRTDARVIQTCGNRVHRRYLTILVLTKIRFHTMEYAQLSGSHRGCCLHCVHAPSRCLTTYQAHILIIYEIIKSPYSVGAAAYTSYDHIRETAFLFQYLFSYLPGYHRLKIPDYGRERMRSHHRSHDIMSISYTAGPFPHSLRYRVLECSRP